MSLTIHAFPLSPRSFKVLWCANHLGLDYEFKLVDFTKSAQNAPDYLTINPNGRAPAIEHDGFVLWESNAIVEYFASLKPEAGLLPQDTRGRVPIAKWLFWESAHWDPACAIFAFERVVKPFGQGSGRRIVEEPLRRRRFLDGRRHLDRRGDVHFRTGAIPDRIVSRHPTLAGRYQGAAILGENGRDAGASGWRRIAQGACRSSR